MFEHRKNIECLFLKGILIEKLNKVYRSSKRGEAEITACHRSTQGKENKNSLCRGKWKDEKKGRKEKKASKQVLLFCVAVVVMKDR